MHVSRPELDSRSEAAVRAYEALTLTQQAQVDRWIRSCIRPSTRPDNHYTSSILAGYFRYSRTSFNITELQFKGAMVMAGYDPTDVFVLHWTFCIEVDQPWIDRHLH